MTRHSAIRIPKPSTASYRASAHIYTSGPLTPENLFAKIHFGEKPSSRLIALDSALRTGWLVEAGGKICLSVDARAYFDDLEVETPKYVGQIAAPRDMGSAYDRPALSKRFIPSSQGFRDDVPEFSVRSAPSFRSVPTGGQS